MHNILACGDLPGGFSAWARRGARNVAREGNNSHQLLEGVERGEGVGGGPAAKRFRERGEWGTLAHKVRAEGGRAGHKAGRN